MPVWLTRGAITGGGILEGGKEHAASQVTITNRKTSFKSELGFKLPAPKTEWTPSMAIKPLEPSTLKTGVTAEHVQIGLA
jgi:hypothetical protein